MASSVMQSNVIESTLPTLRDVEMIPGALKMGTFTPREHGVEVVHLTQRKSSYGARFGYAMMAGTTVPKLAAIKF